MVYRALVFLSFLALGACLDTKEYELESIKLTPTMAFPLANGSLSIQDLLSNKDTASLKVYSDGFLYFSYIKPFTYPDIRNQVIIPTNTTITNFDVTPGPQPFPTPSDVTIGTVNKVIDLNLTPEKLNEMLLKAGNLSYSMNLSQVTNPLNGLPFEVKVTLTDVVDKTSGVPLTFTAGNGSGSKSLQNYIIHMDKNKFNIKLDFILKKRSNPVTVLPNTKVVAQLSFIGLDFTYIKGFFGDKNVTLPPQALDMTIFSSSLNKSKISFVQPMVKLTVENDYGVPCEVTFSTLSASKPNASLPLIISPASPVTLSYPSTMGTYATTAVSVTNAVNVINFSPTQISFSGFARINKGLVAGDDFMQDDSELRVVMNAEVPLFGTADGIIMVDTMNLDLAGVLESSITAASLKVNGVNELPLDANIQLYMADKNYRIIDSVFTSNQTYLVKASSVTAGGELQKAGVSDLKLDLSIDKVNKLFDSNYLIIRSKLNTTKDASGALLNVKFKSTYKLKLTVGMLTQLIIDAK